MTNQQNNNPINLNNQNLATQLTLVTNLEI